jgi:hypothetical protein
MLLFQRLLGGDRKSSPASKRGRRASLAVEALEERTLMSITTNLVTVAPIPSVSSAIVKNMSIDTFSDGNFAAPAQAANGYAYNPTGSPWTFGGSSPNGSGVTANGSDFTSGNPNGPTNQAAFLQGNGQISQSFELSGGTDSISFLAAQRGNAQASFQAVEVWLDNTLVDLVVPASIGYTSYQTLNFTVTGTATHTITFRGVDPLTGNNTAFIADVSIGAAAAEADPNEPAVLAQAVADFQHDGAITYQDMLGLFTTVEAQIAPIVYNPNGTGLPPISIGNTDPLSTLSTLSGVTTSNTPPPSGAEGYCTGGLSTAQLEWMQTIVGDAACLKMAPDVAYLANNVVNGNPANATYQYLSSNTQVVNVALGNLVAADCTYAASTGSFGSTAAQLQELVTKWLQGGDYPTTVGGAAYSNSYGSLFVNATYSNLYGSSTNPNGSTSAIVTLTSGQTSSPAVPNYWDVNQQGLGDCWLISSFAETALQTPSVIESMFTPEGSYTVNGTTTNVWSVRFYVNGAPTYVTVDSWMPDSSSSAVLPALSGAIWVQLAEKAYAEVFAGNDYNNLSGGFSQNALAAITGRSIWASQFYHVSGVGVVETGVTGIDTSTVLSTISSLFGAAGDSNYITTEDSLASQIYQAFTSGQLVTLGSLGNGTNGQIVGDHDYFVIGAQAIDGTYNFTLGNPWGPNGGTAGGTTNTYPAIVYNLSVDDLMANFDYVAFTNSAGPASASTAPGSTTTIITGSPAVNPLGTGYGASQATVPLTHGQGMGYEAQRDLQPAALTVVHAHYAALLNELPTLFAERLRGGGAGDVSFAYLDALFAEDFALEI